MSILRRLPLRLRVTAGFAIVMAAVLAATGMLLFTLVRGRLDRTIDHGLRSRAADVAALVKQADTGLREADRGARGLDIAQILTARGHILDATPGAPRQPLLGRADLARAQRATIVIQRVAAPAAPPVRLLATPIHAQGRRLTVVVGAQLAERDNTLHDLRAVLFIGLPAALALACLAGYGLVTTAMRPVEAMRREAEAISADRLQRRLPVSAAHDELQRLGRTLNAMLDRLAAGLERERAFTADAGHELRTPLTLMKTRLELIAETHPSGADLDDAVRETLDDADGMQTLLDDLLALARLESDRVAVQARDIRAAQLLQRTADRYGPLVNPGVLRVEAPADLVVYADPDRVDQALGNMVDNAIRHGRPPIELTAEARNDCVLLHVRDRGAGFADALAGRAFERFVRGGTESGGAGLGLAIVELVARSHGGNASAAPRPGGGADVWIELPGEPPTRIFRQRSGAPASIEARAGEADDGCPWPATGTSMTTADTATTLPSPNRPPNARREA